MECCGKCNIQKINLQYNFFPQTSWRTEVWVDGKYSFHRFCGKLNSMELVENIFPAEFGYPVVNEFTLEIYFWSYFKDVLMIDFTGQKYSVYMTAF